MGGGVVEVVVVAVLRGDVAGRGELCRVLAPWLLGLGVTRPVDVVDEHALAVSSTAAAARQARRRISTSFPTPGVRYGPNMLTRAGPAVLQPVGGSSRVARYPLTQSKVLVTAFFQSA